jgi:hypothetical protein
VPPVEVERFFAEDGLAGAGRRLDEIGMGINQDGVNRRIGKDRGLGSTLRPWRLAAFSAAKESTSTITWSPASG